MFGSTKTWNFTPPAVYQINRSIQNSNKPKFSYSDDGKRINMIIDSDGCHKSLEIYVSSSFSKQKKLEFKES